MSILNIKPYSGGVNGRPDIINWTGTGITTGLLAEIKTPGEATLGKTQLAGYLATFNAMQVGNQSWLPDATWAPSLPVFWLGAVDPNLTNSFGVFLGNTNGVITYTTFSRTAPPPVPIPIPVTVAETATQQLWNWGQQQQSILPGLAAVIYQTIYVGSALGGIYALIRLAAPAIMAYMELGEADTVVLSLA